MLRDVKLFERRPDGERARPARVIAIAIVVIVAFYALQYVLLQ